MLKVASVHRLQIINRKLFFCELAWCVLRLWERLNANVCVRECMFVFECVFVCVCLLGVCSASGSEREQVQMTIPEFGAWNIQLFIVGAERPQNFRAHIFVQTHTHTHTTSTSRGSCWRINCGVEVTELNTNTQDTLSNI